MTSSVVYLTRRATFSACHRLNSPHLSPEENEKVFGKCNHINGHGHNYDVKVTIRGPVDKTTGMVMNLADLKVYMKEVITDRLDHKNLDKDVDFFEQNPSTTENLTIYIWNKLRERLSDPKLLYEVHVVETENNSFSYRGEEIEKSG